MFVQMKKMVVTEGNAEKVVERFAGKGLVEQQEGFIDASVMVKKVRRGDGYPLTNHYWFINSIYW